MRLALRGGHSTSPAVSPGVDGGDGAAGVSNCSVSPSVPTPSSTSSCSWYTVCQLSSL